MEGEISTLIVHCDKAIDDSKPAENKLGAYKFDLTSAVDNAICKPGGTIVADASYPETEWYGTIVSTGLNGVGKIMPPNSTIGPDMLNIGIR